MEQQKIKYKIKNGTHSRILIFLKLFSKKIKKKINKCEY